MASILNHFRPAGGGGGSASATPNVGGSGRGRGRGLSVGGALPRSLVRKPKKDPTAKLRRKNKYKEAIHHADTIFGNNEPVFATSASGSFNSRRATATGSHARENRRAGGGGGESSPQEETEGEISRRLMDGGVPLKTVVIDSLVDSRKNIAYRFPAIWTMVAKSIDCQLTNGDTLVELTFDDSTGVFTACIECEELKAIVGDKPFEFFHKYFRIHGRFSANGKRHLLMNICPTTDFNEVIFHYLEFAADAHRNEKQNTLRHRVLADLLTAPRMIEQSELSPSASASHSTLSMSSSSSHVSVSANPAPINHSNPQFSEGEMKKCASRFLPSPVVSASSSLPLPLSKKGSRLPPLLSSLPRLEHDPALFVNFSSVATALSESCPPRLDRTGALIDGGIDDNEDRGKDGDVQGKCAAETKDPTGEEKEEEEEGKIRLLHKSDEPNTRSSAKMEPVALESSNPLRTMLSLSSIYTHRPLGSKSTPVKSGDDKKPASGGGGGARQTGVKGLKGTVQAEMQKRVIAFITANKKTVPHGFSARQIHGSVEVCQQLDIPAIHQLLDKLALSGVLYANTNNDGGRGTLFCIPS